MGKRAAVAVAPARATKTAKVVEAATPVDPFMKKCGPIFDFLASADIEGGEECRMMLIAAAPFALRRVAEERHSYQSKVIDTISDVVAEAQQKHCSRVEAVKASIAALETEQATAGTVLQQLQASVTEKTTWSMDRDAVCKAASEVMHGATKSLEAAKAAAAGIADRTKARTEEKAALEAARIDLWEPLRSGAAQEGLTAAQMRHSRDKKVSQVQRILAQIGAPKSLTLAVSVAFKTKMEARGDFANAAVEQSEAALVAYLEGLTATLSTSDSEAAEAALVVQEAEASFGAAKASHDDAFAAAAEAQNERAAEQSKERDHKQAIKGFTSRAKELASQLLAAERSRDACAAVAAKFDDVKMGPRPKSATRDGTQSGEEAVESVGMMSTDGPAEPACASDVVAPVVIATC